MTSNTPNTLPSFFSKPVVANELRVEISDFVGGMVEVGFLVLGSGALQEHDVVIHKCLSEVQVHEDEDVDLVELWVEEHV